MRMGAWIIGIIAAFFGLMTRKSHAASGGHRVANTMGWNTKLWIAPMSQDLIRENIPLAFAVAWIDEESGGNPCAIGRWDQKGPDGNPREMGIAQLYNPDDLKEIGITGDKMRAYCSRDPKHLEDVVRPLTEEEIQDQVKGQVYKIVRARRVAAYWINAVKANWSTDGVDFWRMVKLVHGLPGLVSGIQKVTSYLGRPPTGWNEHRSTIENHVTLSEETEKYRNDPDHKPPRVNFSDIFDNAENTTKAMELAKNA